MCGIIGYQGSWDVEMLLKGMAALEHRGPDDRGYFLKADSNVALGHQRLSIIDVSPLGHQPMISEDGYVALVFNGEIYNFMDLRLELEAKGHSFNGHSDTEVLLHLYLAEGAEMLKRLNGIFAFAIWDGRKRSLFLARDALGVKPLYYTSSNVGFAFASELKALVKLAPETQTLDVHSLHRYLTFLWCPGEGTPLKAVRKLLPGHAMLVSSGKVQRSWAWYTLPAFRAIAADLSFEESREGVVHQLSSAVRRQLVSDVPLGAFLSGGLDSSAIVALAREQVPNLRCFTIDSREGQDPGLVDDLPYARHVAKHLGVPLDVIGIDAGRMAGDFEAMVEQLGEPLADPAPLNVLYISQLARSQGIKVLLSGAGGDDLFTGYRRHVAVNYEHLWSWLPRWQRRGIEHLTAGLCRAGPRFRRLVKLFNGAAMDGDLRLVNYFRWADEGMLRGLYSSDFQSNLGPKPATEPMLDFLKTLDRTIAPLERMLSLEQRFFLADHNLVYTDRMSMAAGVEVRVPYLDVDFVEFAARIPMRFKQNGSVGKWILKQAMKPYLPLEVIYRPKTGFGAPLRRWVRNDLQELVGDLLSAESVRRRGLFDPMAVQALIAQNQDGRIDAAYTIFSLLSIEVWCQKFLK